MASSFDEHVEREMKADREAIERLKRRYPEWEFVPRSGQTVFNMPASIESPRDERESLIQAVERVVRDHASREWTSKQIYEALAAENFPLPAPRDQRMANISTNLGKLASRPASLVKQTYKGGGRDPNRYQWRDIP